MKESSNQQTFCDYLNVCLRIVSPEVRQVIFQTSQRRQEKERRERIKGWCSLSGKIMHSM